MDNLLEECLAVDFEEESHTYLYNGETNKSTKPGTKESTKQGTMDRTMQRTKVLPSVTQIISAKGYGADYSNIPQKVLARASEIGIEVHKKVEDFYAKGLDPVSQDQSANGYLTGFREFASLGLFTPVHTEVRLMHPEYWYAGTIDLCGYLHGEPAILDVKTTNKLHLETVGLQIAAYELLVTRATGVDIEHRAALHLRKDGTWALESLRNPLDTGKFLSLLEAD